MTVFNLASVAVVTLLCLYCLAAKPRELKADRADRLFDRSHWVLLVLLLVLGAAVRFYKLSQIPVIGTDEAGAAYDAWCLLKYGTDRWLTTYPVYLNNFGSGQSALFAYLVSVSYRVFGGYSLFAVRAVSAVAGCCAILNAYLLLRLAYGKKSGLCAAFLYAVCPVFITTARFGLDCYLMLTFYGLSVLCFSKAALTGQTRWYLLTGVAMGLTLYTYILSWVAVPLFVGGGILLLLFTKKLKFKNLLAWGLPLFLFALPLMAQFLVNVRILAPFKLGATTFACITENRNGDVSLSYLFTNLCSFPKLFVPAAHDCIGGADRTPLYLISVPLVALGLVLTAVRAVRALKRREFTVDTAALLAFLALFAVFCVVVRPIVYKMNAMYLFFVYFAVAAIRFLWSKRRWCAVAVAALYLACFCLFSVYLFDGGYNADCTGSTYQATAMQAYNYTSKKFPDRTIYMYGSDMSSTGYICGHVLTLLNDLESPYSFNETLSSDHGSYSYGRMRFYRPVYLDDDELKEEFYDDCVYLMYDYPAGESETAVYISDRLTELGFLREEYLGYSIFYK